MNCLGVLEELRLAVINVERICKENNINCFIDIYCEDKKSTTCVDFDIPI